LKKYKIFQEFIMSFKNYVKMTAFVIFSAVLFFAYRLSAEEAPKTEEPVKTETPKVEVKYPLELTGCLSLQWAKSVTANNLSTNFHNTSQFSATGAQLNIDKKFDDIWSLKISSDIDNSVTSNAAGAKASKISSYKYYLKFGWVQAVQNIGPVEAKFKAGLVYTPVICTINPLADIGWINTSYILKSSDLLIKTGSKVTIDALSDLGASLNLNFFKKANLTGLVSNGYGLKASLIEDRANQADTATDGTGNGYKKFGYAYQGMINITPVQGLNVLGFYRNQNTNKYVNKNYIVYYGAAVNYAFKFFKAGLSYAMPELSSRNAGANAVKDKYSLLDSWANANLNTVIGKPILLHGRFAKGTGENSQAKTDSGNFGNTTMFAFGAGYAFNANVRAMLYYDNIKYQKVSRADSDIMLKSEIKF
jgi:hypothetical protein